MAEYMAEPEEELVDDTTLSRNVVLNTARYSFPQRMARPAPWYNATLLVKIDESIVSLSLLFSRDMAPESCA